MFVLTLLPTMEGRNAVTEARRDASTYHPSNVKEKTDELRTNHSIW